MLRQLAAEVADQLQSATSDPPAQAAAAAAAADAASAAAAGSGRKAPKLECKPPVGADPIMMP
jgi:hypothetical protein|eukprot:COSAG01_NODE_2725_length_7180_cov_2.210705_7_plen_63_part_00